MPSNLDRLLQKIKSQNDVSAPVAGGDSDDDVEHVPQRTAFLFNCTRLHQHQHYCGLLVALPEYDAEAKDKVFSRLNTDSKKSWTYCPAVGKKSLFVDLPQMTGAWRCLTSDDYDTWKSKVEAEVEELTDTRYTFVDKGHMPLATFYSDERIALDIAKDPAACEDDEYYFDGEPGSKDKLDAVIGKYEQTILDASKPSPHTPPKKRQRSS